MVDVRFHLLLLAGAIFAGGCHHDNAVEVTGMVTLDDQPIEKGAISFRPVDGNGPTAEAMIVAGKFDARLLPGAKRVEVQGFRQQGEEHAMPGDPTSPLVPRLESIVPSHYQVNSKLQLNVDRTTRQADFALTTSASGEKEP